MSPCMGLIDWEETLLDLVVFGRAAGIQIEKSLREGFSTDDASTADIESSMKRLRRLNESTSGEKVADVRNELQSTMQLYFGVFREGESMQKGLKMLDAIGEKLKNLHLEDKSDSFNTARIEALELENLYEVAYATAVAAEARKESWCARP